MKLNLEYNGIKPETKRFLHLINAIIFNGYPHVEFMLHFLPVHRPPHIPIAFCHRICIVHLPSSRCSRWSQVQSSEPKTGFNLAKRGNGMDHSLGAFLELS